MLCVAMVTSMLLAPVSALAVSKSSIIQIARVTADDVRMRGADKSIIGKVPRGTRVFYLNQTLGGSMCLVCTSNGMIGYIWKGYLTAYGAVQAGQIYYANRNTPAYNLSRKRIGTLGYHHFVIVYETRGDWAYVKTMSGLGGVVALSSLSPVV